MNTEERTRHYRGGHRCHHRQHGERVEGRGFGAHGGRTGGRARMAFDGMHAGRRHGGRHDSGPQIIQEMRMQIHELERRVRRLQRQARYQAMSPEDRITRRPRRRPDADFIPARDHFERRMHAEGRRMGRMMRRVWLEREERHHDM